MHKDYIPNASVCILSYKRMKKYNSMGKMGAKILTFHFAETRL